jgi:cytochrome b561
MAMINAAESDTRGAGAHCMAFALAVCAVGTASVLRDAWPKAIHWPFIDLHAAFGVLLCLMVLAQFYAANLRGVALYGPNLHTFCRGLKRLIFLTLYVLFGVHGLVHVAATLWNNGLHGGAQPALLQPPESLRVYLAYGVVALILIRVFETWAAQRSSSTLTLLSTALRSR